MCLSKILFYLIFFFSLLIVTKLIFLGAAHGDEIEMIFYSDLFQVDPKAKNEMTLLQQRMTRLWTNFVKYGLVYKMDRILTINIVNVCLTLTYLQKSNSKWHKRCFTGRCLAGFEKFG